MKKAIKKMSESEMMMMKAVIDFRPFDREGVLIEKGDMKAPDWNSMLDWEDNFPDWWEEDEAIPMKDMTRQKRRKYRFTKDMARWTRARDLGYDLSIEDNPSKVKTLLSASHADRMYFRGAKAQKLGKAMSTKTALDLVEQMKWEAEMDREAERKEAEHQLVLDELASTTDDLSRLEFAEKEMTEAISDLIRTIYEANDKLVDYQAKMNDLREAEKALRNKIAHLEEAVNS